MGALGLVFALLGGIFNSPTTRLTKLRAVSNLSNEVVYGVEEPALKEKFF